MSGSRREFASYIPWRFYLLLGLIALSVLGLVTRVIYLVVFEKPFLQQQSNERVLRKIITPVFRGMILDRNHFPLAVSTKVFTIWFNPQTFSPDTKSLHKLSSLLKLSPSSIKKLSQTYKIKNREFGYLQRGVSPQLANKVKLLAIPGLYAMETSRRYYPEAEVAAHLVGFTNIDDKGQEGLELAYNQWLSGSSGKKWVIKDPLGRIIEDVDHTAERPGNDLILSIDRRIQYMAYRELLSGIFTNEASAGSVIVLDVETGEVLAMVNYPSFNPNNRGKLIPSHFRNRAITDTFEPGSTIKAFSIASAFETGQFNADSVIDTAPGYMRVDRNIVRDGKNNGEMTIAQILQISSNVGVTKIVLNSSADQLYNLLHKVGFGEITGIGFPGEEGGSLQKPKGAFTLATLGFGYGLAVTPLQLARAYSVLANGGIKKPVTLLKVNQAPQGELVMKKKVADEMLQLLEAVLNKGGTGTAARIPGYRIAGKTGTAKLVGEQGYQKHRYESSFVGIAPLSHPRVIVAVVIHDPQGKQYYGGPVAGPIFKNVMQETLRILDVPHDS
ncbi:MAG: penicillin-binding protein 2 [Gammaproteobacteria bacterium]|nr:penicillin-binding protein 2 [Gammaproteobacteria bacterium]